MISWELRSLRMVLPLAFVVQVMISSGLILGLGFLMDDITATEARFLAVGVTVVSMITLGMVMAPQLIASQKQSGAYEYLLSLPVPRDDADLRTDQLPSRATARVVGRRPRSVAVRARREPDAGGTHRGSFRAGRVVVRGPQRLGRRVLERHRMGRRAAGVARLSSRHAARPPVAQAVEP